METSIASLISVAALVWFVLGPYNAYRLDRLRHDLFKARDELFRRAAADEIRFDSHAYQTTRTILNGMIRYAHQVSLSRFLSGWAIMSHDDVSRIRKEIDQLMAGSSVADRVLCEAIIKQAHLSVAYHLLTSPFIGVVTIPLTVIALGRLMMNVADIIVKWQPRRFQTLDGLFYRQGAALNT